ncbi:MAG TPA: hypothetical protein VJT75_01765 [Thermoleophilaceae bacterium]|nr:hypothetical protein [Thermoleophilaceae bacterium]
MRPRLTYANVISTIALFIALGGVSVAVTSLPNNSVGARQLKTDSVRERHIHEKVVGNRKMKRDSVDERVLADNAVGPFELQGNSVGSDQLAPESVGERELKPGARTPQPHFAHVSSSGVLGEQSGVEQAGRSSKGQYFVKFNRSLRGCVAVASVGFGFGPGVIGAGATAQPRMNLDNDATKVGVTVYRKGYTFNDIEDNDVSVIVAC